MDTQINTCDNKKMTPDNEKRLRRFKVFDVNGNLLETVEITRQYNAMEMYVVRNGEHASYTHTMSQAMQLAESLHLAKHRQNGQIVKQVLI